MKKIGMLFPDYASQYVGMAKELYDSSRVMQEYFEEASNCLNVNFVKLCFAASDIELSKIDNAYTALFLTSAALAAFLKENNIMPTLVAGYGIGEFSAVHVAGGLSLPDGLYLLNKYAHFYEELLGHLKVSLMQIRGIKTLKLKKLCSLISSAIHKVYIAAYNNADDHLLAGHTDMVNLVAQGVKELGGIAYKDRVERGLHGDLMEMVVNNLKKYLTKVDFKDLQVPLIASVDGLLVQKGDLVKRRLMKQLHAPLLWDKVMASFAECDIIVEIGPGTTLSKLVKQQYPEKPSCAINKKSDFQDLEHLL